MSNDTVRWEYETLRPPREATRKQASDPKAELNELGSEGWELAETIEYIGGGKMVSALNPSQGTLVHDVGAMSTMGFYTM